MDQASSSILNCGVSLVTIRATLDQPAKSPSWWVRDVHIVLVYGNVNGMWLLKSSESTAKIRLLGPSRMVQRDLKYSYMQFAENGSGPPGTRKEKVSTGQ